MKLITNSSTTVARIISGGQTGADQGALAAALSLGLEHGGWCPHGRRTEDGRDTIPREYQLREHDSPEHLPRTRANVETSDGTLVITRAKMTPGSVRTVEFAHRDHKPVMHVRLDEGPSILQAPAIRAWLSEHAIETLNVAGSRESTAPGIHDATRALMVMVLG